ncbi:hypothetical protein OVA03_08825 [Asticcacaulis sp. SL142]|uniref:hypothetical protein n=1 Tax=Asticcacaulis sp. SL142 TaxID=2995155 RepID=UPI00226CA35F|nr:hypothetical protein [Asticcacaulis sp. SL142]WAC46821.1 hypothetical protein OVA03_08825 [Asticcacaulis sp. SL142]
MKKLSNFTYWPLKLMVGLPLTVFAIVIVVQLPKLWSMMEGDPYRLGFAVLQGGLPVLPFVFYALAIWFGADMIARVKPDTVLEPILIKGLKRSGLCLGAGSIALFVRSSLWIRQNIYGNDIAPRQGLSIDFFHATIALLIGLILYCLAERIRLMQVKREKLTSELSNFV